jgi:hypothetical protein
MDDRSRCEFLLGDSLCFVEHTEPHESRVRTDPHRLASKYIPVPCTVFTPHGFLECYLTARSLDQPCVLELQHSLFVARFTSHAPTTQLDAPSLTTDKRRAPSLTAPSLTRRR